jgi:hypothetical protein
VTKKYKFGETVGKEFNGLWVLSERKDIVNGRKRIFCTCQCFCENKTIFETRRDGLLRGFDSGGTTSCGCKNKKQIRELGKKNKKYNKYDLSGEFGIGYTAKDEPFYFDLEDYEKIKDDDWRYDKDQYVVTGTKKMHRVIFGLTDPKIQVDHIRFHNYDNRKSELRVCSNTQNNANKKISSKNKSGIIGVTWEDERSKWKSQMHTNGLIFIKRFNTFKEAVIQRLLWEKEYFKEFAPQQNLFGEYGI